MVDSLSLILLMRGPDRIIERAVRSLARQTVVDPELVVVHDRDDEAAVWRVLGSLRGRGEVTLIPGTSLGPGAARNAGIRASGGRLFAVVDGSEDLDPAYLESMLRLISETPLASFAVAVAPDAAAGLPSREPPGPVAVELTRLLSSPWAVPTAAVIRREAYARAGGFDELLPGLVEWDLLLTLTERGEPGVAVERPLLERFHGDDVALRSALRADRHLPAIRRAFAKHRVSFEAHTARVLTDRDGIAKALWRRERELVARRDKLRTELGEAIEEISRLRGRLREQGRDVVEWGDLRRPRPLSRAWGLDRGRPIDRHYIETFLERHAADVRGRVLEVLDRGYTGRYGAERVEHSDVLDVDPGNRQATILADLRWADSIPGESYDCFILTQTLHLIDDMSAALAHAYRILKPGGVLLATLPCASMVAFEYGGSGDHWRVTAAGARSLFERQFPPSALEIRARGNVLAMTAFLCGLTCDEVTLDELETDDPAYPLLVTVRAVKPGTAPARPPAPARRGGAILLYHRVASLSEDVHHLAVRPETFLAQVELLRRRYRPMPLSQLAEAALAGEVPEGAVAITFDDGYLDSLETAAPILDEFDVPATFFVNAEGLDAPKEFWWDALARIILTVAGLPKRIELRVGGERRAFRLLDDADRHAAHGELYALLRPSLPAVRDDVVRQLSELAGPGTQARPGSRPMDRSEICRLAASPRFEIGAHGFHHLPLPALSAEHRHREVFGCRSALETVVGSAVTLFAYPYGDVSPESIETVQAADFRFAVTCRPRCVHRFEHALELPRCEVPGGSVEVFGAWLEGLLG